MGSEVYTRLRWKCIHLGNKKRVNHYYHLKINISFVRTQSHLVLSLYLRASLKEKFYNTRVALE